jgi:hypothetical protein
VRFPRLLAVFFCVTLVCGAFGATVGGLIGVSLPDGLATTEAESRPGDLTNSSSTSELPEVREPRTEDRRTGTKGAALGGALGLLLGVVLGVPIALLDQAVLIGRTMLAKRGRAPPEPM